MQRLDSDVIIVGGGAQVMSRTVHGAFGIPQITQNGLAGGLFHNGSAFVLQNVGIQGTSRFVVCAIVLEASQMNGMSCRPA